MGYVNKPFTVLKKPKRAWAKFLYLFLLPLKYLRRTEVAMEYNVCAMSSGGLRAKQYQNTENYERRTNIK